MLSRSRKRENVKPLASIVQTVTPDKIQMPLPSTILVATQQPRHTLDHATIEQELQAIRQGQHTIGAMELIDIR